MKSLVRIVKPNSHLFIGALLCASLLSGANPSPSPVAQIEKTALEQTLILQTPVPQKKTLRADITPADSTLTDQKLFSLKSGSLIWVGVWNEGNSGKHLRAWIYSSATQMWDEEPLANATSDLKILYSMHGDALDVEIFELQEDQSIEKVRHLRFPATRRP